MFMNLNGILLLSGIKTYLSYFSTITLTLGMLKKAKLFVIEQKDLRITYRYKNVFSLTSEERCSISQIRYEMF